MANHFVMNKHSIMKDTIFACNIICALASMFSNRSQTRKEKPKNRITKDDRERDSERHSRSSSTASYPKPKW